MPFNLSRRVGEALEVQGVLIEIQKIEGMRAILKITCDDSVRIRYKDLSRNAKRDSESAQDGAIAEITKRKRSRENRTL